MQHYLPKIFNFFFSLFCITLGLTLTVNAAKLSDAQAMAQNKIKELASETCVLKHFIADEEKICKFSNDDNEVQIHQAMIRTYKRIIELNDTKTIAWEALATLGD